MTTIRRLTYKCLIGWLWVNSSSENKSGYVTEEEQQKRRKEKHAEVLIFSQAYCNCSGKQVTVMLLTVPHPPFIPANYSPPHTPFSPLYRGGIWVQNRLAKMPKFTKEDYTYFADSMLITSTVYCISAKLPKFPPKLLHVSFPLVLHAWNNYIFCSPRDWT